METMIPADDPVRLLSAFVEGMDLSELYATYDRVRKNQATPRQMLKIMIYAFMNRLFSSRDIETACKRDINSMFLLEGMPAPDHSTIARFISLHLSACSKTILANVTCRLCQTDIKPMTPAGMPLIAMVVLLVGVTLGIYALKRIFRKK